MSSQSFLDFFLGNSSLCLLFLNVHIAVWQKHVFITSPVLEREP